MKQRSIGILPKSSIKSSMCVCVFLKQFLIQPKCSAGWLKHIVFSKEKTWFESVLPWEHVGCLSVWKIFFFVKNKHTFTVCKDATAPQTMIHHPCQTHCGLLCICFFPFSVACYSQSGLPSAFFFFVHVKILSLTKTERTTSFPTGSRLSLPAAVWRRSDSESEAQAWLHAFTSVQKRKSDDCVDVMRVTKLQALKWSKHSRMWVKSRQPERFIIWSSGQDEHRHKWLHTFLGLLLATDKSYFIDFSNIFFWRISSHFFNNLRFYNH